MVAGGGGRAAALRTVLAACVLVPLLLSPHGCGYNLKGRPGSRFADPALRVDLRPFANAAVVPDAGAFLSARLREELRRVGFVGAFDPTGADFLIEGKVGEIREDVSSHGADGYALEHRLTLVVDIRVQETARGRFLWKEEGISETASYFAGADFQYTESNRRAAFEELCRRMARKIGLTVRVLL